MSRKAESITLSVSEADKQELEAIALELGCTWGDKPNLSKLVSEIAQRKLLMSRTEQVTSCHVNQRGKRAIASIIKGLTELSLIWFG